MEALHQDRGLLLDTAKHCAPDVTDVWNIHTHVCSITRRLPLFAGASSASFAQIYCEYGKDILNKSPYAGVTPDSNVDVVIKIGADVVSKGGEAASLSSTSRKIVEQCCPCGKCSSVPGEKNHISAFQKCVEQAALNLLEDETCMYVATTLSTVNDQETLVSELKNARRMLSSWGRLNGKICVIKTIKEKHVILRFADSIIHGSHPGYDSELDTDLVFDDPIEYPLPDESAGDAPETSGMETKKGVRGVGGKQKR